MGKVNVDKLNELLRGEISAVETYRMALDKVEATAARTTLQECQRSHEDRVRLIREEIIRMGGEPATTSGAWGTWAKAVEGTAKIFGEKAAISALEEGEDHGLKDYRADFDEKDDYRVRSLVTSTLRPQQERTHRALSTLKKQLS
jgi:bacterioferritin (cytochrome b1)